MAKSTVTSKRFYDINLEGLTIKQVEYLKALVQNPQCEPGKEDLDITNLREIIFKTCDQAFYL